MPRTTVVVALLCATLGSWARPADAGAQGCPGAAAQPRAGNGDRIAAATLCLVNARRAARGLPAFADSAPLRQAATAHSADMVARRYFDHTAPGGGDVGTRVRATGYRAGVLRENVGWGGGRLGTPRAMVLMWMRSPPHRASLLATDVRDAGAGAVRGTPQGGPGGTWTLVLAAPRS